jgi:hypothetical protein
MPPFSLVAIRSASLLPGLMHLRTPMEIILIACHKEMTDDSQMRGLGFMSCVYNYIQGTSHTVLRNELRYVYIHVQFLLCYI